MKRYKIVATDVPGLLLAEQQRDDLTNPHWTRYHSNAAKFQYRWIAVAVLEKLKGDAEITEEDI